MTSRSRTYIAGVAVAVLTSLLIVWTTIVQDDGRALGTFAVIMAVGVGAFAVRAHAEGMARTLLGAAVMQILIGTLIATAPVTATQPGGVVKAWVFAFGGAALWLISAALFRAASQRPLTPELV